MIYFLSSRCFYVFDFHEVHNTKLVVVMCQITYISYIIWQLLALLSHVRKANLKAAIMKYHIPRFKSFAYNEIPKQNCTHVGFSNVSGISLK